jgi:hypothetical protein
MERAAPAREGPWFCQRRESGHERVHSSNFIHLPNSVCLHSARGMKAKVLKGVEENQVDVNVFRITVVATFGCIDGTQCTFEEELSATARG